MMNDQSNMATSFLKGAYNALKPFSAVSKSYAAMSHSTFSFGEMKNGNRPVAVILMMDSSRMGQGEKIMAALQSSCQTEWQRHPNKHVSVYYVGDKALNAEIYKLPQFFTWAREFSVHLILYIQSISACREVYGKESVGTFLGQSDVVSFLPKQRNPEMLELATLDQEINTLLDRLVDASSARVVQAYEKRIDELEHKKLLLSEKVANVTTPKHSFEDSLEHSLTFLANLYKLWCSRRFTLRRLMLKLVFTGTLNYDPNQGYRTPKTTITFNDLGRYLTNPIKMVPQEGHNLNAVFAELAEIEEQLKTSDIDIVQVFEELGL